MIPLDNEEVKASYFHNKSLKIPLKCNSNWKISIYYGQVLWLSIVCSFFFRFRSFFHALVFYWHLLKFPDIHVAFKWNWIETQQLFDHSFGCSFVTFNHQKSFTVHFQAGLQASKMQTSLIVCVSSIFPKSLQKHPSSTDFPSRRSWLFFYRKQRAWCEK